MAEAGGPLGAFVVGPALLASGRPGGPLSGWRFAVKDLFDVAGQRTGAGSPEWLEDAAVARTHAPAVAALLQAGADLLGKTVTDELAFSMSGTNPHYGTPGNPAAPGRVPGGSSSGSASAVASGAVELALGSDTGGSVRVPASYCGILGIRPSHGRISLEGVVPLAPSFDTPGLFATTPERLQAGTLALLAGAPGPAALPTALPTARRPTPRRLVLPVALLERADAAARPVLRAAAAELAARAGLLLEEPDGVDPDELDAAREAFRTLQLREAWRSHGEWITARRPQLGPGVGGRFAASAALTAEQEEAARPAAAAARARVAELLGSDGLLCQPAASGPAPPVELAGAAKDDLRARTLTLTALVGLAGAPALSLPVARLQGLPVGLVVAGAPGEDELLLELAARCAWPAARTAPAGEGGHGR